MDLSSKKSTQKRKSTVKKASQIKKKEPLPDWLKDAMNNARLKKEAKMRDDLVLFIENTFAGSTKKEIIKTLNDVAKDLPRLTLQLPTKRKEVLKGGFGDYQPLEKYPKEQIIKGIEVEMEHTNNPFLALEITLDHLEESATYYDRLEEAEHTMERDNKFEEWKKKKYNEFGDVAIVDRGSPWKYKDLEEVGIPKKDQKIYLDDSFHKEIEIYDAGVRIGYYNIVWNDEEQEWVEY